MYCAYQADGGLGIRVGERERKGEEKGRREREKENVCTPRPVVAHCLYISFNLVAGCRGSVFKHATRVTRCASENGNLRSLPTY